MPVFIGGIRTLSYGTTPRLDFRNQTITRFHAVSVLRLGCDEVREVMQYLNTHGLRLCDIDQIPPGDILKRMTADATSGEWNHRPQVVFGTKGRPEQNQGRTNNAADSQSTDIDTPASSHAQPVAPSPAVTQ